MVRNCSSNEQCPGRWFSGPWSQVRAPGRTSMIDRLRLLVKLRILSWQCVVQCSADCGWGKQVRIAVCVSFDVESKNYGVVDENRCKEKELPSLKQACFSKPCNSQWFSASWSDVSTVCNVVFSERAVAPWTAPKRFPGLLSKAIENWRRCQEFFKGVIKLKIINHEKKGSNMEVPTFSRNFLIQKNFLTVFIRLTYLNPFRHENLPLLC